MQFLDWVAAVSKRGSIAGAEGFPALWCAMVAAMRAGAAVRPTGRPDARGMSISPEGSFILGEGTGTVGRVQAQRILIDALRIWDERTPENFRVRTSNR